MLDRADVARCSSLSRGHVRVRGQVASTDDIARVVQVISGVPGVHAVDSFMHLPGEPAPNKEPARSAGH